MKPDRTSRDARRRAPGNALVEFVLTLPIIFFMTGLTIYMSMAMLSKQQALVEARYRLYRTATNGYWPPMIGVALNDTSYTKVRNNPFTCIRRNKRRLIDIPVFGA